MYLLPVPRQVNYQEGGYSLPYDVQIVLDTSCERQVYEYALLLKETVDACAGRCMIRRDGGSGSVRLAADSHLRQQQYELKIGENGVTIRGGSSQGILYGIQTLRQIVEQSGMILPYMTVNDWPDFEERGYYHDVTRGRIPKMEWLRRLADTLSYYKVNQLQLYIEHSFLFQGMSELWRDDTPLTAEEIMEFDRYCIKRGIELVPSLSTFGHLYKLLSTEQYRRYCELSDAGEQPFGFKQRMDHHTVDVSDEGAFSLICSMIRQFLPLFSSHRFNICADETFDLGKGKNTERAEKEGRDRLYIDYVKKLCAFIMDQGSTPMLWGDVLLGFPELAKELPKEAVCLNWGYAPDQSEDSTRIYAAAGVRQYVCPGVGGWNQFVNLQRSAYENISRMSRYGRTYGCEGLLNTDWGDFGHINHPAFCIPGLICGAAASWNRDALPSYDELNTQISVLQYSDTSGRFSAVTGQLAVQESFGWREAVMVKEVWEPQGMEVLYSELKLLKDKIESEPEKSEEIERCIRDLKLCTRTMSHEKRGEVYPYLIAAEGMRLFNRIGMIFWEFINKEAAQNTLARSKTLRQEAYETAGALEEWYYHYRMLWSSISRESELYRIGEVIFWYADALRKRVAANEW